MSEQLAYKRRAVLEKELEDKYEGRLCKLPCGDVVRIENSGVEWQGKLAFTVIIHGGSRRRTYDYADFKEQTIIYNR
jgi:hypothetical protein